MRPWDGDIIPPVEDGIDEGDHVADGGFLGQGDGYHINSDTGVFFSKQEFRARKSQYPSAKVGKALVVRHPSAPKLFARRGCHARSTEGVIHEVAGIGGEVDEHFGYRSRKARGMYWQPLFTAATAVCIIRCRVRRDNEIRRDRASVICLEAPFPVAMAAGALLAGIAASDVPGALRVRAEDTPIVGFGVWSLS
jgi:hypothetical protein